MFFTTLSIQVENGSNTVEYVENLDVKESKIMTKLRSAALSLLWGAKILLPTSTLLSSFSSTIFL